MNHKASTRILLLVSTLASLLLAGCASVSNQPFTAYGGQEKIHLKVGANITDDLRMVKNDKWKIPIGQSIATNVPVFARHTFDNVVDMSNGKLPPNETVTAIFTPKVAYFTRTVGATAGGESIVDFEVEWSLNDANGNPIWVDTIDGRSSDKTRTDPKKVSQKALDDLLLKSQQAISSAPAIKQFAQKPSP
jgi:outer membrane lipoprotein SlyB